MTDEFEEKALVQATTKPDGPQCDHLIWEAKAREIVEDRRTGQRGMWIDTSGMVKLIATALAEAVAAEREACAKIADAMSDSPSDHEAGCAIGIADAIRARSQGDVSTQSVRGDGLCDHPVTEDVKFLPGTHGCHEALDRASYLADQVDTLLAEHPAIRLVPEWLALANEAVSKLATLYQKIGTVHLAAARRQGDRTAVDLGKRELEPK